jgi:hypothetical protein
VSGGEPEALVLEAVRREVDEPAAAMPGLPVDVEPVDVERGERVQQRLVLVAAVTQRRGEHALVEGGLRHRGEDRVRADLQEPRRVERADAVGEADRLAHLADPVLGARDVATGRSHDRDARRLVGDRLRDLPELVEHRLHERGVERVRDVEPRSLHALVQRRLQRLQRRALAGQHDRPRAVDRRQRHTVRHRDVLLARLHGEHRSAGRQRAHQPPPREDHPRGVLEREHAGDVRAGDLADGMTQHRIRTHTDGGERARQRDLHREDRRLRRAGVRQRLGVVAPHHLTDLGPERLEDLVQRPRERRPRRVQLAAHPDALRPLAGQQKGEPATRARLPDHRSRGARVGADQHRAVLEPPAPREGHRHVHRPQPLDTADALDLRRERRLTAPGDHPRTPLRRLVHHRRRLGRLLDDHVRVRPADAKRRHARPPRAPITSHSASSVSSSTRPASQSTCATARRRAASAASAHAASPRRP